MQMKRTAVLGMLVVFFCLLWLAAPADAYERGRPWRSDQPWEKLSVKFGWFLTTFASDVSLTGSGGGVIVNLEDLLGLDTTTNQFRLEAHYRAWRRHHFHFAFYDLSRDAVQRLDTEIPTDPPVPVGFTVASNLDIRIYKAGYSFSFWNDDRVDLGVGLSFHIMDLGAGVEVLADAGGDPVAWEQLLAEAVTLPLPVLGLRGNVAITKRVFLKAAIEAFYISLSGYEGLLLDTNIALEGHICRFFGLGMAFNFMRVNIEGDGDQDFLGGSWSGNLDFDYTGLSIYAKFFF
jgi:hypothetical protein